MLWKKNFQAFNPFWLSQPLSGNVSALGDVVCSEMSASPNALNHNIFNILELKFITHLCDNVHKRR